jgi:chaperonin GroEL (HSP60 family)
MAQDELVGDGTTSVVILTGELLHRALDLVSKGVPIHIINQVGSYLKLNSIASY